MAEFKTKLHKGLVPSLLTVVSTTPLKVNFRGWFTRRFSQQI